MSIKPGDRVRLKRFHGGDERVMGEVGTVRRMVNISHAHIDFPHQRNYLAPTSSLKLVTSKKRSLMTNIRQKINNLTMSEEDRLFQKYEITTDHAHLTELGRRIVLDKLFQDKDIRAAVLADVKAVETDETKKSK